MATQAEKAEIFRKLHQGPAPFLMANAWDGGSARVLTGLGFAALATSSGASAGALGKRDGILYDVRADIKVNAYVLGLYTQACTMISGRVAKP